MIEQRADFAGAVQAAGAVALLVDGDNLPATLAGRLLTRSASHGRVVIKRVYGNMKLLPLWEAAPGFRLCHSGGGKNATDMLLAIEAVDLAHRGGVRTIVIASSDRDFAHLAHYLRERHLTVIGMGEAKAPEAFRQACTDFVELAPPSAAPATMPVKTAPQNPPLSKLDQRIRAVIAKADSEGISIVTLSGQMHSQHGFTIGSTPEKTWRAYLTARPALFACDPRGPDARVRLAPAAQAG